MENKHEQLYVAVQDLLIGLGISPKKLRFIATQPIGFTTSEPKGITPKIAQKLIDTGLIVEKMDWRNPNDAFSVSKSEIGRFVAWENKNLK